MTEIDHAGHAISGRRIIGRQQVSGPSDHNRFDRHPTPNRFQGVDKTFQYNFSAPGAAQLW